MRFIVTSNDLLQQLLTVAKAISSKSVAAIPVLENILFELKGNTLQLTASDQSNRLTSLLEVQNQGADGTFAVRSNIIIDALKELPDQPIEVEVEEEAHKATVTYSNGIYTFLTSPADVYPEPTKLEGQVRTVELPAQALLRGLERTAFAASDDDRRPIMTGVYLDIFTDKLVFVASDGRILVRYTDTNIKNDARSGDSSHPCELRRPQRDLPDDVGDTYCSSTRGEVPQLQFGHPHRVSPQHHGGQGSPLLRQQACVTLLQQG